MADPDPTFDIGLVVDPRNMDCAYYFTGAMAGLVILFILWHWSRYLLFRYGSKTPVNGSKSTHSLLMVCVSRSQKKPLLMHNSRLIQRFTIRKVFGFTSAGHSLVVFVYVA